MVLSLRIAAGMVLAATVLAAQQETEDDLAFVDELARTFRRGGSYAAVRDLDEYLQDFPESVVAHRLAARVAVGRGQLEQAEVHLHAGDAGSRPGSVLDAGLWGRLLLRTGRYEEALDLARSTALEGLPATVLEVSALDALGRRNEARRVARDLVATVDDRHLDPYGLMDLARLFLFLRDFELANQALVFADAELNGKQGPNYRLEEPDVLVLLGRVYGETRQSGRGGPDPALSVLNEVLEVDSGHPEALAVKARVYSYGMQGRAAGEALTKALDRDASHPEALVLRGRNRLLSRQVDAALAAADRVLATDPRHREALALRASALFVGARPEAQAARERFEESHPESAVFEALLGRVLQDHYRFADSVAPLERALVLEPDDESPLPVLAQSLAHLGREQEARAALEDHRRRSPYDYPWRENMLDVLAKLSASEEIVSESGFRLRLPPGEQDVLGPLLLRRLERARREMAERWGVDPSDEVIVEVFDRHADFSVRTVGFTGFLALGACFGNLFTMLSPQSEMRGNFHWMQTAVHEYAHVVTLALSRQRVPRWLTEGISVVEEKRVDPAWGRELERAVLDARANGDIFPVAELDEAFRDGSTVMLGYYQGSLVCEVIEQDFGFEKLRDLVASYADDRSTAEAIRSVLEIEPAELDERLDAYLTEVVAARATIRPRYSEVGKNRLRRRYLAGDASAGLELAAAYHDLGRQADEDAALKRYMDEFGETPEVLRLLAERDVVAGRLDKALERFEAWVEQGRPDADGLRLMARLHAERGEGDAARARLYEAWRLFPGDVTPHGAARLLLAQLDPEDEPEAWDELAEAICAVDEQDLSLRVRLAQRRVADGDSEAASRWYAEAVAIDPYRPTLRMEWAGQLQEAGRVEEAREQWRLVLATRADQVPSGPAARPGPTLGAQGPSTDLEALQKQAREALDEGEGGDG